MDAAEIICAARRESGLRVRDLARRSGVAESRISDYEHGRHQPSVAMLQRLLDATGHDLVAERRASPRAQPATMPTMGLVSRIPPVEPRKRASPKAKIPPSDATNQ